MGFWKGISLALLGNFMSGFGQSLQKVGINQQEEENLAHKNDSGVLGYSAPSIEVRGTDKETSSDNLRHRAGGNNRQFLKSFLQVFESVALPLTKFEKDLQRKGKQNAASTALLYVAKNKIRLFGLSLCFLGELLAISMALSEISTILVTSMCSLSVVVTLYFSGKFYGTKNASREILGSLLVLSGVLLLVFFFSNKTECSTSTQLVDTLVHSPLFSLFAAFYLVSCISAMLIASESVKIKGILNKRLSPALYAIISSFLAVLNVLISKVAALFVSIQLRNRTSEGIDIFEAVFKEHFKTSNIALALNATFKSIFRISLFTFFTLSILTVNTVVIERYKYLALRSFKPISFQVFYFGIFIPLSAISDILVFNEIATDFLLYICASTFGVLLITKGFIEMAKTPHGLPRYSSDVSLTKID